MGRLGRPMSDGIGCKSLYNLQDAENIKDFLFLNRRFHTCCIRELSNSPLCSELIAGSGSGKLSKIFKYVVIK